MGQQKLVSLWVWILLLVALCPGAQYTYSKGGGVFGGGRKGESKKGPPSQSRGFSKQGLKWAGGAAAGILGGTGTGYGLGFLGRPKHGSKDHYGHKTAPSEEDGKLYYNQGQRFYNQSRWRVFSTAAPAPMSDGLLILGHVVPLVIAVWTKAI